MKGILEKAYKYMLMETYFYKKFQRYSEYPWNGFVSRLLMF
jgi:hypothetical protein